MPNFITLIQAGRYHTLTVNRISDYGLYLADDEGNEVLLPNRFVSLKDKPGDTIRVFVYHDSEDRLVATTEKPLAEVGDIAVLRVVDKNLHGAFLDWGLAAKDLFLPNRNQQGCVVVGHECIVRVYEDSVTGRAVASMKLGGVLSNEELSVAAGDSVEMIVASRSDIGYRVIVNGRHWGMLYHNQIFTPVKIGQTLKGYVRRTTEDNRVDVALQKVGFEQVKDSSTELLRLLEKSGGELPIGDKSTPEEVSRLTGMSKKVFKRALGVLLKQGVVAATDNEIKKTVE